MSKSVGITLSEESFDLLSIIVKSHITGFYDDPFSYSENPKDLHAQLQSLCLSLHTNFEDLVKNNCTIYEVKRMKEIIEGD